jgi:hypothetical protein
VRSEPTALNLDSLRDLASAATADSGTPRNWRKLFRRDA